MILFLAILAIFVILTSEQWYMKLIALITLSIVPINVLVTTITHSGYTIQSFSEYLLEKQSSASLYRIMQLVSKLLSNDVSLVWNCFFILIFGCILVLLVYVDRSLLIVSIFLIGLASHAMMGFSASIFKSRERTAFILYMVIIYIISNSRVF